MSNPEYKEKEFLIYLYDTYTKEHPEDLSELGNYSFGLIRSTTKPDGDLFRRFPELKTTSQAIRWCDKTENLGYTEYPYSQPNSDSDNSKHKLSITLTKIGYDKAFEYKFPIRHFLKENWKWLIPVTLSTSITIIEIIICT